MLIYAVCWLLNLIGVEAWIEKPSDAQDYQSHVPKREVAPPPGKLEPARAARSYEGIELWPNVESQGETVSLCQYWYWHYNDPPRCIDEGQRIAKYGGPKDRAIRDWVRTGGDLQLLRKLQGSGLT